MSQQRLRLGVIPTRRTIFSEAEALKQKKDVLNALADFSVDIVNIDDTVLNGILSEQNDVEKTIKKLATHDLDGLFFPHCDFGTEFVVAQVAAGFDLPVLVWGSDENEIIDGKISRYTQCGMFATGKALRRYGRPFDYIVSCAPSADTFKRGFTNFLGVCSVIRAFKHMNILQVSTRPAPFWSVMCNEGELLEKFRIRVTPMDLSELTARVIALISHGDERVHKACLNINQSVNCACIASDQLFKIMALKVAIEQCFEEGGFSGAAIQCWSAMQDVLGIMPCATFGQLCAEFMPIGCETDVKGVISSVMLQEALQKTEPVFFADITTRHPENRNANLLWHCGNFPATLAKKDSCECKLVNNPIQEPYPAAVGDWQLKDGPITICRFDEDFGAYSLLIGEGKAVEGPKVNGTYVWMEVDSWPKWEEHLVTGPYIHHVSGIYGKAAPVLYASCKYIHGLKSDLLNPSEETVKAWLRGELN